MWFFGRKKKQTNRKQATWNYERYSTELNSPYLNFENNDAEYIDRHSDYIETTEKLSARQISQRRSKQKSQRPKVNTQHFTQDETFVDYHETKQQQESDLFPVLRNHHVLENEEQRTFQAEFYADHTDPQEFSGVEQPMSPLRFEPSQQNQVDILPSKTNNKEIFEKIIPLHWRLVQHIPFICLVLIALIKTTSTARELPLSVQEAFNWFLTTQNLTEAWNLSTATGLSPYYNLLQRFIISFAGDSLIVLRAPSIFSYTIGLFLIYAYGSLRLSREIGLTFSAFFAFSFFIRDQATANEATMIITTASLLYLILAIEALNNEKRYIIILSIIVPILMIQIQPLTAIYIIAVIIGVFFDTLSIKAKQFRAFAIWGIGQLIAVMLALVIARPFLNLNLLLPDFFNNFGTKLSSITTVIFPNAYFATPVIIGSILAIKLLHHPIFLRSQKPILIGAALFSSTFIPILVLFSMEKGVLDGYSAYLLGPAFMSLIVLSGLGFSQLSTLPAIQFGFLALLFSLSSAFISEIEDTKSINTKSALESYNSSSIKNDCVLVYPEQYQYTVWYGLEHSPNCFAPIIEFDDINSLILGKKNISIFFFIPENGDGSLLKSLVGKLNTNWKIGTERHGKILLIQLTGK